MSDVGCRIAATYPHHWINHQPALALGKVQITQNGLDVGQQVAPCGAKAPSDALFLDSSGGVTQTLDGLLQAFKTLFRLQNT